MDKVKGLVPDAVDLLDRLDARAQQVNQLGDDLTNDILQLRESIGLARGEANRVSTAAEKNNCLPLYIYCIATCLGVWFKNTPLKLRL